METGIIVSIISACASIGVCALTLYFSRKAKAEERAEKAREKREAKRSREEDDTVSLRIKKIESAEEFRGELLNLWRESRDGWAKCEKDRQADKEAAAKAHGENRALIHDLRSELDQLKKGLGDAVRPSSPPPPSL